MPGQSSPEVCPWSTAVTDYTSFYARRWVLPIGCASDGYASLSSWLSRLQRRPLCRPQFLYRGGHHRCGCQPSSLADKNSRQVVFGLLSALRPIRQGGLPVSSHAELSRKPECSQTSLSGIRTSKQFTLVPLSTVLQLAIHGANYTQAVIMTRTRVCTCSVRLWGDVPVFGGRPLHGMSASAAAVVAMKSSILAQTSRANDMVGGYRSSELAVPVYALREAPKIWLKRASLTTRISGSPGCPIH